LEPDRYWRRLEQPHLGTRVDNYRCSLPGLAGFTIYRCEGTVRVTSDLVRRQGREVSRISECDASRKVPILNLNSNMTG